MSGTENEDLTTETPEETLTTPSSSEASPDSSSEKLENTSPGEDKGQDDKNPDDLTSDKEAEETQANPYHGAPETDYEEFTLPDGAVADEKLGAEFKPLAKELGLSQAGAQKLVEFKSKLDERAIERWNEHRETLREQAKSDPELGKDYKASITTARGAIKEFGTPEFRQMLDDYGVGSHPEMIRFCQRVGLRVGETPSTTDNAGGVPGPTPLYDRMYKD